MNGPDPTNPHPMNGFPQVCFIKNTVRNPNIVVGNYSYYDDPEDSENFERNVLYHYPFIGDKLVIGKFCASRSSPATTETAAPCRAASSRTAASMSAGPISEAGVLMRSRPNQTASAVLITRAALASTMRSLARSDPFSLRRYRENEYPPNAHASSASSVAPASAARR